MVLERLLRCDRIRLAGMVLSSRILLPRYSRLRGAYQQIRTSGVRYALYLWTATTLADVLLSTFGHGSVSRQARRLDIPRRITRDINGAEEQRFLHALRPDLLVSAFFNQRIAAAVYSIPSVGAVNIHPSLLPEYRGVDPVFHARLRRSTTLGVSVHRIDADFDTGNLLAVESAPVIEGESVLKTTARLFQRGAELVAEQLGAITAGVPGSPQPAAGTYDSWPAATDVAALRRGGTALFHIADLGAIAARRWT